MNPFKYWLSKRDDGAYVQQITPAPAGMLACTPVTNKQTGKVDVFAVPVLALGVLLRRDGIQDTDVGLLSTMSAFVFESHDIEWHYFMSEQEASQWMRDWDEGDAGVLVRSCVDNVRHALRAEQ